MMSTNYIPGFSFPVASPYATEGDGSLPSMHVRVPMPMAQPFQHGSDVFGQPSGNPSPPPDFRPVYGPPPTSERPSPAYNGVSVNVPFRLQHPATTTGTPQVVGGTVPQGWGDEVRELNAEDIKPNDGEFSKLSNAIRELEICKKIFEQCDDQFVTEFMAVFPKESLEFRVRDKTDELKATSSETLATARQIHDAYKSLAQSVVEKLRALSESGREGTLFPDARLAELWGTIEELSQSVKTLTDSLRSSIVDLGHLIMQTKTKYEHRSFRKKLWEWLVRFFEAIANALGIARRGITAAIGGAGLIGAAVGANRQSLIAVASVVCVEMKNFDSKQEQGFQKVLDFLRAELPKSIKKAQISLTSFNAFQAMQQEDLCDRTKRLTVKMTVQEATRSLEDWEAFCHAGAGRLQVCV